MQFLKSNKEAYQNIPPNTNKYIYEVLENSNYPANTQITIDEHGGLSISSPHTLVSRYFDKSLPPKQKITCPKCKSTISNDGWTIHINSRKHKNARQ